MTNQISADTPQAKWARFRFSIVGPLLAAPPLSGQLKVAFQELSQKEWLHPLTDMPVYFSVGTIERWFYQAKNANDPIKELGSKRRVDADKSRRINTELQRIIRQQYNAHQGWSYQLHTDNLAVKIQQSGELGSMPSYSTIHRYMKANGFCKRRAVRARDTEGAQRAAERLEKREVRSFEMDYVNSLCKLPARWPALI